MLIPCFPDFVPITLALKNDLHPALSSAPDGVSEYTFANLYLFRARYNYKVSLVDQNVLIVSGERDGKKFFATPCACPDSAVLNSLFASHDYWKGIPDSILEANREKFTELGINITEDRDNFDYLYLRTDLANLSGKKFHKKKNLVNAFLLSYPDHEVHKLTADRIPHAVKVLNRWKEDKGSDGDYIASLESLELVNDLELEGTILYIQGKPAGYCLGETVANNTMFALHFEKCIDEYKGVYQFINQSFADSLADHYIFINREQDLGDEGLRQAKLTYRPCGYVRKYIGKKA